MNEFVFAADLGGTNLRMAAVDRGGAIRHLTKKPVPKGVSPEQLMALISKRIISLMEFHNSVEIPLPK